MKHNIHGVPLIAASIRLRVGLGGSDSPDEFVECSCSASRVFPWVMTFGSIFLPAVVVDLVGG